jgi:hypothetical protein
MSTTWITPLQNTINHHDFTSPLTQTLVDALNTSRFYCVWADDLPFITNKMIR